MLPEMMRRWYTLKRSLFQVSSGLSAVCFCRTATGESLVTCANQVCPISTFHLACLKITKVPNKWFCPLCQKTPAARTNKSKGNQTKDILNEALNLYCICVCKQKPMHSDTLLKCHNPMCQNGKFFYLPCLHLKRMPNNAKTTWECAVCTSGGKGKLSAKGTQDSSHMLKNVVVTGISTCSTEKSASLAKLTKNHFQLILSPSDWLDCDIIHEVQVCLRNINPGIEGLQRPTLGPCRNFNQVDGEFIQILHTGKSPALGMCRISRV